MDNSMTVAEILDALYDAIGSTWVSGKPFVSEVADWLASVTEADDEATEEKPSL